MAKYMNPKTKDEIIQAYNYLKERYEALGKQNFMKRYGEVYRKVLALYNKLKGSGKIDNEDTKSKKGAKEEPVKNKSKEKEQKADKSKYKEPEKKSKKEVDLEDLDSFDYKDLSLDDLKKFNGMYEYISRKQFRDIVDNAKDEKSAISKIAKVFQKMDDEYEEDAEENQHKETKKKEEKEETNKNESPLTKKHKLGYPVSIDAEDMNSDSYFKNRENFIKNLNAEESYRFYYDESQIIENLFRYSKHRNYNEPSASEVYSNIIEKAIANKVDMTKGYVIQSDGKENNHGLGFNPSNVFTNHLVIFHEIPTDEKLLDSTIKLIKNTNMNLNTEDFASFLDTMIRDYRPTKNNEKLEAMLTDVIKSGKLDLNSKVVDFESKNEMSMMDRIHKNFNSVKYLEKYIKFREVIKKANPKIKLPKIDVNIGGKQVVIENKKR